MAKDTSKRLLVVNILGGLGYISCILQWLWVALLYLPLLLSNDIFKSFILPEKPTQPIQAVQLTMPPLAALVIGSIVTIGMIVLTVYILVKVPATVTKKGQKITQAPANALVPIITHHKKISAKKRLILSTQLIIATKLTLITIPLLISLGAYGIPSQVQPIVIIVIAGFFASGSLLWFTAQYLMAAWLRVKPNQLV